MADTINQIFLTNLYKKTFLIYLNTVQGKIQIFSLQYEKVQILEIQLSVPSDNYISVSTIDNLIIFNSHSDTMSMIYDMKRKNPQMLIGPPMAIQFSDHVQDQQSPHQA